ncbi:hypothetical protein BGX27_007199 [Mortierella sp. AM989]|nr:hypothetical protein BGX27_007199 [Mortierella sp. AM989]
MTPKLSAKKRALAATTAKTVANMAQSTNSSSEKSTTLSITPISTDRSSTSMSETSDTSPVSASSATTSSSTYSTSVDKALPVFISNTSPDSLDETVYEYLNKLADGPKSPSDESIQAHDTQKISKKTRKRKMRKDTTKSNSGESLATVGSHTSGKQITSIKSMPLPPPLSQPPIETQDNTLRINNKDEQMLIEAARVLVIDDQIKIDEKASLKQVNLDEARKEPTITNNNGHNNNDDNPVALCEPLKQKELDNVVSPTNLTDKMMAVKSNDTDRRDLSPNIRMYNPQKDNTLVLDSEKEVCFEQKDIIPGMQPRSRQQNRRQPSVTVMGPEERFLGEDELFREGENVPGILTKLREWEDASEKIVRDTIQCLFKDNDMELSYISILSTINVLSNKFGQEPGKSAIVPSYIRKAHQSARKDARERIGKLYSKLLKIMTRSSIAEALSQEIAQQGTVSPEALYLKLYNAIQDAGYTLQDQDHLQMCQFLLDRQTIEEATICLNKIDSRRWNSAIYRASITCHLFSKPRHLHEAEVVLDRYLEHIKMPLLLFLNTNKPNSNPTLEQSYREKERNNKALVKKWFKLQLDASKWEEIKSQYGRRRARLLDAPENIERFSLTTVLDSDHRSISGTPNILKECSRRGSTASSISTTSSAFTIPQVEIATSVTVVQQPPSNILKQPPPTPASTSSIISPFSFFSSFMSFQRRNSYSSRGNNCNSNATVNPNPTVMASPTQTIPPNLPCQQNMSCSNKYQINRYLTALDNGMLEECIDHKQFQYGWEKVYERMGPALEDKDTAKIAMRLCKRAFLGHGGLGPNQPGSPNILAKDMCFEDERSIQEIEGDGVDDSSDEDESKAWETIKTSLKEKVPDKRAITTVAKKVKQEDPEIWEARAWVIYNKAMMNPLLFNSNGGSPTGYPIQLQPPPSIYNGTSRYHYGNNASSTSSMSLVSAPHATTATTTMAGTSSLTVFLHNIMTVAINSPEKSSRFLKAFKIYSTMRNDPLNQYQAQLRDPFVMTCMIKAIYDAVLAIMRTQKQQQQQRQNQDDAFNSMHLSDPEPTLRATSKQPTMTIGPLIDLAFEIYADMRNVGPIRNLPQLSALAPSSPTSHAPGIPIVSNNIGCSSSSISSMSMFFQLSNRSSTPSSSAVDLSACSANTMMTQSSSKPSLTTSIFTRASSSSSSIATSANSSTGASAVTEIILQDLNPTLIPSVQARRLPSELYLALLHLCIQVPLSGIQQSFRVVKTITTDMMSNKSGQQPANLDRHLAAALQFYHDQWMCRPQELKVRRGSCCDIGKDNNSKTGNRYEGDDGCIFREWMYRSDEYVLKHMSASHTSSDGPFVFDLSDTSAVNTAIASTFVKASDPSVKVDVPLPSDAEVNTAAQEGNATEAWEESSQYSISKHDADLDELDQYLRARAVATEKSQVNINSRGDSSMDTNNSWMDSVDHDTCNDRFYWDLWGRQDHVLQNIRFSRRRARMLWRHVGSLRDM